MSIPQWEFILLSIFSICLFLVIFCIDVEKKLPAPFQKWFRYFQYVVLILWATMSGAMTVLFLIGSWNAYFDHRALWPIAPLLFILFLLNDISCYCLLRKIHTSSKH